MPAHTGDDYPYKEFKFRILWEGRYVAGIGRVSGGLKRTTEPETFKEGGDPSTQIKWPGSTFYEPVILERGVTRDLEFERWANIANERKDGKGISPEDYRKDLTIVLMDEHNAPLLAFKLLKCRVSEYQAFRDTEEGSGAEAIQLMRIENEGWERLGRTRKTENLE